ncbi:hypothetical protein [Agrococcus jejuensis]|uniref:Uncharacterized protein n=1 Tax=Agrococcus jejuensis TaxID=399736 RepID=A0A1G8C5E9_9MICO|nr:hypothetical protein [Agrococcus jejuensis]SDH40558.1 hypothetical protein SAMN04489720_1169 [Agrococcus jejuensis]
MTSPYDASGDDRSSASPTPQPAWSSSPQPPRRVEKPATVKWGLGILWVGVVLTLVLGGFAFLLLAGAGAQAGSAGDGAVVGLATVALVVGVVLVGVEIWFLVEAGKGKAWARMALAITCVASLVIGVVTNGSVNFGAVLTIVAVVLLFLPASNEWYDAQRRTTATR